MARLSEVNQGLYATFVRPAVRAMATPQTAEALRLLHPNRLQFSLFSDRNPFMAAVGPAAALVRQDRRSAEDRNPLLAAEHLVSDGIQFWLKSMGRARDMLTEHFFHSTYGSPALQAALGLAAENAGTPRHAARESAREAAASATRADAEAAVDVGGVVEAFVRAVMYVARPVGQVDERGLAALKEVEALLPAEERPGFVRFKEMVRQQFLALHLDEERAIEALPKLAGTDEDRRCVLAGLGHLISLRPSLTADQQRRLERVNALLTAPSAVAPERKRVGAKQ